MWGRQGSFLDAEGELLEILVLFDANTKLRFVVILIQFEIRLNTAQAVHYITSLYGLEQGSSKIL